MEALEPGTFLGQTVDSFSHGGLSLNRTTYLPDQPTGAMHFHAFAHISLVLKGGNLEKRRSTLTERTPGCVTYYHAYEPHQTIQKRFPAQHLNLELDDAFLSRNQITGQQLDRSIQVAPNSAITILKLYHESRQGDCFSTASVEMLVHELLSQPPGGAAPAWVKTIGELMQDRWNESLTLNDLAAAAGVHPVTISKYFPKYFHMTMGEYLRRVRVSRAIALIKSGRNSLTDIAFHCGFSDQSHFTRTFQQLTGFAPGRFREL